MKAKILREFLGLSNHSNERIGLISKQVLYSSYDLVKSVVDWTAKWKLKFYENA